MERSPRLATMCYKVGDRRILEHDGWSAIVSVRRSRGGAGKNWWSDFWCDIWPRRNPCRTGIRTATVSLTFDLCWTTPRDLWFLVHSIKSGVFQLVVHSTARWFRSIVISSIWTYCCCRTDILDSIQWCAICNVIFLSLFLLLVFSPPCFGCSALVFRFGSFLFSSILEPIQSTTGYEQMWTEDFQR